MSRVLQLPYSHQAEFLNSYFKRDDARTLLVGAPGSGKTRTAQVAAARMLADGLVDRLLVVVNHRLFAEQWRQRAAGSDNGPSDGAADATTVVTTYTALSHDPERVWSGVPTGTRWLFVFEEVDWVADRADRLEAIAADALLRFPGSRALFIATIAPPVGLDARFAFDLAFYGRDALVELVTQTSLTRLVPSIGVLQKIQRKLITLDDLGWREFEKLIARMLESDGYNIELMQGSKDGGVDVVAIKDLGDVGLFKSIWQAKKHRLDRKVGLSLVRELADTRLEHGASKAIIVTTSYLTSGALDRVERDRYLLGKVDRTDLDKWIERTLRTS